MRNVEDIVTDAEVIRVHAYANFGPMSPREVVNDGVRKYAVGYSGGHTQQCILYEHGLIGKPKGYSANLTKKGKEYARALGDADKARIEDLERQLAEEKALADGVWSAWGNWRADDEFLDEDEKGACAAYRKARGL